MAFQAHLVMTIRERGITRATQVAWEVTERFRDMGHEACVTSVNKHRFHSQTPPAKESGEAPETKGRGRARLDSRRVGMDRVFWNPRRTLRPRP
jgi:hypothetical protein